MKCYGCSFVGREKNAIGIFYGMYEIVKAKSPERAKLKLYEKYEHIMRLEIIELNT